jgi:hypothetical protein
MKVSTDDETDALERRVAHLRGRLDLWLTEADRRRHALGRAINVPRQVRLHPGISLGIVGAVLALAISSSVLAIRRARRRRTFGGRAGALYNAFGRMMKRPDRVAETPPHLPKKVLTAALTAAASALVKKQLERLLAARPSRALPPMAG